MNDYLQVRGLTSQHKEFLKNYAQENLGSSSRTKAILHLIENAMQVQNKENMINDEVRKKCYS